MERRQFLKHSALGVTATGLAGAPAIAKSNKFRWRLAMAIPKNLPIWGEGVQDFAAKVKEETDGELSIKVYGAGELVPALGTFEAVQSGRIQMGHAASYYWQGKMPASVFFTAVPFGLNPAGMRGWLHGAGAIELWEELYRPFGITPLPAGNTGMQMGGWFNKEINKVEDFRGLKMRIPGLGGKVLAKLGGKPVLVPGGEIYTNLSTGVLDATEWVGPYHDYTMGFHKAAKYYYAPGWHEPGPVLELMINTKAWLQLPKDLQAIVRSCAAELDRDMYAKWAYQDAVYFKKIKTETRVVIKQFPDEVLAKLMDLSEQALSEIAQIDKLSQRIYQSFMDFRSIYRDHQRVTNNAYMKAVFS